MGQMVGVYDDSLAPRALKAANEGVNQGAAKNRKKRVWSLFGQGQQAGAQPCRQDHCLHNSYDASLKEACQGLSKA